MLHHLIKTTKKSTTINVYLIRIRGKSSTNTHFVLHNCETKSFNQSFLLEFTHNSQQNVRSSGYRSNHFKTFGRWGPFFDLFICFFIHRPDQNEHYQLFRQRSSMSTLAIISCHENNTWKVCDFAFQRHFPVNTYFISVITSEYNFNNTKFQ